MKRRRKYKWISASVEAWHLDAIHKEMNSNPYTVSMSAVLRAALTKGLEAMGHPIVPCGTDNIDKK